MVLADDHDPTLPEPLVRELRELYAPPAFPGGRDAELLAAARRAGARQTGSRHFLRWAAGIAAAVALATLIWQSQLRPNQTAYARTGDIRDAFYVARQLKAHARLDTRWDVNGDGIVDDRDVQALALAAVKLDGGGSVKGAVP